MKAAAAAVAAVISCYRLALDITVSAQGGQNQNASFVNDLFQFSLNSFQSGLEGM